jgi:hypothetical protein
LLRSAAVQTTERHLRHALGPNPRTRPAPHVGLAVASPSADSPHDVPSLSHLGLGGSRWAPPTVVSVRLSSTGRVPGAAVSGAALPSAGAHGSGVGAGSSVAEATRAGSSSDGVAPRQARLTSAAGHRPDSKSVRVSPAASTVRGGAVTMPRSCVSVPTSLRLRDRTPTYRARGRAARGRPAATRQTRTGH